MLCAYFSDCSFAGRLGRNPQKLVITEPSYLCLPQFSCEQQHKFLCRKTFLIDCVTQICLHNPSPPRNLYSIIHLHPSLNFSQSLQIRCHALLQIQFHKRPMLHFVIGSECPTNQMCWFLPYSAQTRRKRKNTYRNTFYLDLLCQTPCVSLLPYQ